MEKPQDRKFILVSPGGFGKKQTIYFLDEPFSLDELVREFGDFHPAESLRESDIPLFEYLNRAHYRMLQLGYFAYKCVMNNIESEEAFNNEMINGRMEKEFRLWYYERFKEDKAKIKK